MVHVVMIIYIRNIFGQPNLKKAGEYLTVEKVFISIFISAHTGNKIYSTTKA